LVENIGASGGFLVPPEFREELLAVAYEKNPIRQRATIIPMRRRQISVPTLDQTGTTAGQTRMHGGIVASWTEEAAQKDETEPDFRQITLTAHKLVCYTEASDELLADDAVGLVAVLSGPMGWGGAIEWEEEYTFLRGTGAGQPNGVINHAGTVGVVRAGAGAININDLFGMLQAHHGENPIWHINRGAMTQILNLNGPAGNPSYVFIDNAREGLPMKLFGFEIHWTEKLPVLGQRGDILLADWRYYLVGDRQATTIDSSQHFRFRNDLTAWRAVHRVDGQPWLSAPITLADGTTQISPFVVLDEFTS
jgi:HK97 family phage major capsid protein